MTWKLFFATWIIMAGFAAISFAWTVARLKKAK